MFTLLHWYDMWQPLFITGLLDSYSVRSQTPSRVSFVLVYSQHLNYPSTGKLSLLSQSYIVPFFSEGLAKGLARWEPLELYSLSL